MKGGDRLARYVFLGLKVFLSWVLVLCAAIAFVSAYDSWISSEPIGVAILVFCVAFAAGVFVSILIVSHDCSRKESEEAHACSACGYSREGLGIHAECPECGCKW